MTELKKKEKRKKSRYMMTWVKIFFLIAGLLCMIKVITLEPSNQEKTLYLSTKTNGELSENGGVGVELLMNGEKVSITDYIESKNGIWEENSTGTEIVSRANSGQLELKLPWNAEIWLYMNSQNWLGTVSLDSESQDDQITFETNWERESWAVTNDYRIRKVFVSCAAFFLITSLWLFIYPKTSDQGKSNKIYWLFYICILARIFYFVNLSTYSIFNDSAGYMEYQFNSLRQPLYPYIIQMARYIFGEQRYLAGIVLWQMIIGIASAVLLYKALKLWLNDAIAFVTATFYGSVPILVEFEFCILTDSFSITFLVVWISLLLFYLKKPRYYLTILISIASFILVMIRPSNIILGIILLPFWGIRIFANKSTRKIEVCGLCSFAGYVILVLGYSWLVYIKTGYMGVSSAGMLNVLITLIMHNLWHADMSSEVELMINAYAKNGDGVWEIYQKVVGHLLLGGYEVPENDAYKQIQYYINDCIQRNLGGYIEYNYNYFMDTLSKQWAFIYPNGNMEFFQGVCLITWPLRFISVFLIFIIQFIYDMCIWIMKKKIRWITLGLSASGLGFFVGGVLGAPIEAERHSISIIPICIILIAFGVQGLIAKRDVADNN